MVNSGLFYWEFLVPALILNSVGDNVKFQSCAWSLLDRVVTGVSLNYRPIVKTWGCTCVGAYTWPLYTYLLRGWYTPVKVDRRRKLITPLFSHSRKYFKMLISNRSCNINTVVLRKIILFLKTVSGARSATLFSLLIKMSPDEKCSGIRHPPY